jgi:hypothetical protein
MVGLAASILTACSSPPPPPLNLAGQWQGICYPLDMVYIQSRMFFQPDGTYTVEPSNDMATESGTYSTSSDQVQIGAPNDGHGFQAQAGQGQGYRGPATLMYNNLTLRASDNGSAQYGHGPCVLNKIE